MAELFDPRGIQISKEEVAAKVAICDHCKRHFPTVKATILQGGKKVEALVPVAPFPVQALKKKPNLISLGGRPAKLSDEVPDLGDQLEAVIVYVPHELVCDARAKELGGHPMAVLHQFLTFKHTYKPDDAIEEGETN